MISRPSLTLLCFVALTALTALAACAHQPQQTVMAPEGSPEENGDAKDKNKTAAQVDEDQRAIAINAGLLGAMKEPSGALANIFGSGSLSEIDISNSIADSLIGAKGTQIGSGGLGSTGAGLGGGGGSVGSLGGLGGGGGIGGLGGLGGAGELGDLGGRGVGGLGIKGNGSGGLGSRGADKGGVIQVRMDRVVVVGPLDKDIILRVLSSRQNHLRYCYERELNRDPNIGDGSLKVQFKIDEEGKAADVKLDEVSPFNKAISECALNVMRRFKFPKPEGGTVKVTQTLTFRKTS